jgi:uroporphyrinogen decarboxylase
MAATVLTRRERVLMALDHKEPDRVPIDFGGTSATSIFADVYRRLRSELKMAEDKPIRRYYAHTEVVQVDDEIVRRFDGAAYPIIAGDSNVIHYADQPSSLGEDGFLDEFGVAFGRLAGSPYHNVLKAPFEGTPEIARIAAHAWPRVDDPKRIAGLKKRAQELRATTDGITTIGLGGRFLSFGQNLCGFANWMTYMAMEPDFCNALLDKALELQAGICAQVLDELGDLVDVVMFNDDLGTQQNLQISPRMYRAMIKPRQRALYDSVKQHTRARIFLHTDGAIAGILPDLIEIGVDIINPVQPTCAGMDTQVLKQEFGRDLTFWGSVDTQEVMPMGRTDQVADEVKRRIDHLAPGGGFVLAAVHNIQPDVPPQNIIAMYEAAQNYGKYHQS